MQERTDLGIQPESQHRTMMRILILRPGRTAAEVRQVHGDYDRWFTDAIAGGRCSFDVRDVTREEIPPLEGFAGVIVTGSVSAAYRQEPWMARLIPFLANLDPHETPVLGVCFGAQILAHARGGSVIQNPEGWEIGGVTVEAVQAASTDPLFLGLPPVFGALATHEDRIEAMPPGAVLLAGNAHTPIQAFRIGSRLWGVQFHPEATREILSKLIRLRADQLSRDAVAHGEQTEAYVMRLLDSLRPGQVDQGRRILDNFVSVCLRERLQGQGSTPASPSA